MRGRTSTRNYDFSIIKTEACCIVDFYYVKAFHPAIVTFLTVGCDDQPILAKQTNYDRHRMVPFAALSWGPDLGGLILPHPPWKRKRTHYRATRRLDNHGFPL